MIVGRKDRFAIESELGEIVDGWVLGRFRFWVSGESVGNWDDAVDLKGCVGWLRDFASCPRDRFDPSLLGVDAHLAFRYVFA